MTQLEKLQRWLLYTPFGQYVLRNEQAFYNRALPNIFGYYALQIGCAEVNFLQENKIRSRYIIERDLKCYLNLLPLDSNSIDLIVCPHALELTPNYTSILEELYRVLMPRGKLVITGFNKHSLFTTFGHKQDIYQELHFIKLNQLKQQLNQLKFSIDGGQFFCYNPPSGTTDKMNERPWLDKVGDRWFPTFANNYGVIASKELVTPTRIQPQSKAYRTVPAAVSMGATRTCHARP